MPYTSTDQTGQPVLNGSVASGGGVDGPRLDKFSAKTSAYTCLLSEWGTTFTNRGATASVTFTLPAVTSAITGVWYKFYAVSNYGMVIASNGSSDNIVARNDAGADSVTFSTTSLMIGACARVAWDGTGWLCEILSDGNTLAVA